ncbi:hypothetical protein HK102_006628 [Quaeritorhiza haematococci]|nr:hypothetical protein HK102_006628 [Quaeritorhiza haematococci]
MTQTTLFNATSTAEQVAAHFAHQARGKTVIVTGANTGLGLETSRVLALHGAAVILCSRNPKNGEAAVAKIKESQPDANVATMTLDLGSLKSVKDFADEFLARYSVLNILINNAGLMACPKASTTDGFETQFGVCHIGHFYLTELLMPLLIKSATPESPSRVVNLSSIAQFAFAPKEGIKFDDINGDKHYSAWERYGQAKLANLLHAKEIHTRYRSQNVLGIALHPGVIMETELTRHSSLSSMLSMGCAALTRKGALGAFISERNKNTKEGAATSIVAALDPDVVSGGYYYDCNLCKGDRMHPLANDAELARKLWDETEKLIASKGF